MGKTPMLSILVYDITEDRNRTKIADACLDYGLDRFQNSAYAGFLDRNAQEELMLKIEALLDDTPGSILLVAVDKAAWEKRIVIGPEILQEVGRGQLVSAD